jgi:hypothetical protein
MFSNLMIQNKNEFGKLPEIELVKFEKANNVKLPADYRDFFAGLQWR